jgi:hypothetical protein
MAIKDQLRADACSRSFALRRERKHAGARGSALALRPHFGGGQETQRRGRRWRTTICARENRRGDFEEPVLKNTVVFVLEDDAQVSGSRGLTRPSCWRSRLQPPGNASPVRQHDHVMATIEEILTRALSYSITTADRCAIFQNDAQLTPYEPIVPQISPTKRTRPAAKQLDVLDLTSRTPPTTTCSTEFPGREGRRPSLSQSAQIPVREIVLQVAAPSPVRAPLPGPLQALLVDREEYLRPGPSPSCPGPHQAPYRIIYAQPKMERRQCKEQNASAPSSPC